MVSDFNDPYDPAYEASDVATSPRSSSSGFNVANFGGLVSSLGSAFGNVFSAVKGKPTAAQLASGSQPGSSMLLIGGAIVGLILIVALIARGR